MKPRRVQLRRTKGWRLPPNTIVVSRPSKWGNPWKLIASTGDDDKDRWGIVNMFRYSLLRQEDGAKQLGFTAQEARRELRGKNLACWCRLDQPCHADVLIEVANA